MVVLNSGKQFIFLVSFFYSFFLLSPLHSGGEILLAGEISPAFSDHQTETDMPAQWLATPFTREAWAMEADIAVSLDQHLYPALVGLIQNYGTNHGLTIAVREGTCGISSGLLNKKAVDLAGFCCPPSEIDRLPGLRFHTIGLGGLAVFVHPDNPVDSLTVDQVRGIFAGEIKSWAEITGLKIGPDPFLPIHPVVRPHCKFRPGRWRLLLDHEDLFGINVSESGSIEESISKVSADSMSIGIMEAPYMLNYRYPSSAPVKILAINGIRPDDIDGVVRGDYPFYLVFNVTTWEKGDTTLEGERLIAYLIREVEKISGQYGLVSPARLRKGGWKFKGDELIAGPQ